MQNCTFRVLRLCVWAWMKAKQHCKCFRPEKGYLVTTQYVTNPPLCIEKVLRRRENGMIDEKYKLQWIHLQENNTTYEQLFQHVMPPWLMISKDGDDYTEQLHAYIAKGNVINIQFLQWKFGTGKWTILDTKTFEEVEFPSSGIIIK